MEMTNYSYVILKYRHDVAAGEVLNIGVVMYSAETGQIGALANSNYGRLSGAFANFDGNQHRAAIGQIEAKLTELGTRLSEGVLQLLERSSYADAGAIVRSVWPDQGLAYFISSVNYGICADFERELEELYDRFVLSQQDHRDVQERFSDDAVWSKVRKVLSEQGILNALQPVVLGDSEVEFQHAYKNGKWHVFEPISLDYINGSDIKDRALLAVGKAAAMLKVEEFGTFNVIVGKPRRVNNEKQYQEGMQLLKGIPVPHKIIDEENVDRLAAELRIELEAHNSAEHKRLA